MKRESRLRKNIYEGLKSGKIDLKREYSRIFSIFYDRHYDMGYGSMASLEDIIEEKFRYLSPNLIGRCLSLDDFNDSYNYNFSSMPKNFSIDIILDLAEYVVNFVNALMMCQLGELNILELVNIKNHIDLCMDDIGYKAIEKEGIIIYLECSPAALSVAEITGDELSYSVLRYNHHTLKGNLTEKKMILKSMADDIENSRKVLKEINKSFTDKLFRMLNFFARHNNEDNEYLLNLNDEELESIYDDIYQIWLLAKLQLEYNCFKNRIETVLNSI